MRSTIYEPREPLSFTSSLKVYWMAFNSALQAKLEYKLDFIISMGTSIMLQAASLGFLWVVFHQTQALGGWDGTQVLFLFGMTMMSLGLSELLFNHIWMLPMYVVMGDLDRLLTYPVHSLPFLLISKPELHSFGNILMGILVVSTSLMKSQASWIAWAWVPLGWICGSLIYTSFLVIFASLSFRFVGPHSFSLMIPHTLHQQASRYPLSIYPSWLKYLLLVLIPYGVAAYLPGRVVFDKGVGVWGLFVAPIAAALCLALAHRVWIWGLKQYQSTGS
jgi:ABC-2 type transport system permease protein